MHFKRAMRITGKRFLYDLFVAFQRLGVNVLPMHFYSPIPDINALRKSNDWMAPRSMQGIASLSLAEQLTWLSALLLPLPRDYDAHAPAVRENGTDGYGEIEAQVLAAF